MTCMSPFWVRWITLSARVEVARIVEIPRETIDDLGQNHHRIMRALWWATLVDEGTLRSWLVSMGQRPADQQWLI